MNSSFTSLWDQYQKVRSSYYSIETDSKELLGCNAKKRCEEYIREHFDKGKKRRALVIPFDEEYSNAHFRHIHMVSLYLLGRLLIDRDSGNSLFGERLSSLNLNGISDPNKYVWFQTCLYHDTASCIEKMLKSGKESSTEIHPFNGDNSIYKNIEVCGKKFTPTYSKKLIENYYRYARDEFGNRDHGIIGGALFYDKIVRIFNEKTSGLEPDSVGEYPVKDSGLSWNRSILDAAAYISDAIMAHNLWTCSPESETAKKYKEYKLDELIISSDEKKISISRPESNPLLFLLCFLDTIEPIKRFWKESDGESEIGKILKLLSIQWRNNKILVIWNVAAMNYEGFYDWMKSVFGMRNWMDISISPCKIYGKSIEEGTSLYIEIDLNCDSQNS